MLIKTAPVVREISVVDTACTGLTLSIGEGRRAIGSIYSGEKFILHVDTTGATRLSLAIEINDDPNATNWDISWRTEKGQGTAMRHSSCPHLPFVPAFECAAIGTASIEFTFTLRGEGKQSALPTGESSRPPATIRRFFVVTEFVQPQPKWRTFLRSAPQPQVSGAVPDILRLLLDKQLDGIAYLARHADARQEVLTGRRPSAFKHWLDKGAASGKRVELASATAPSHGTAAQWLTLENEQLRGLIAVRDEEIQSLREQVSDQSESIRAAQQQLDRAERILHKLESLVCGPTGET